MSVEEYGISRLRHIFKDTTYVKPVHAVCGTPFLLGTPVVLWKNCSFVEKV